MARIRWGIPSGSTPWSGSSCVCQSAGASTTQETATRGKDREGKGQGDEKGTRFTPPQVAPLLNVQHYPNVLPSELACFEVPEKITLVKTKVAEERLKTEAAVPNLYFMLQNTVTIEFS